MYGRVLLVKGQQYLFLKNNNKHLLVDRWARSVLTHIRNSATPVELKSFTLNKILNQG